MEGTPSLSQMPDKVLKRVRPADSGSDKKKKDKDSAKKAYIPSYVQAGEKCVVCGDNSTGTHYRAMTCEGCKGFFRRTIQKSKGDEPNLVCKKEGKCEMTPQTRNACQFCRYKKCLAVKMDPASVLNEIERSNLQRLIATNRRERQKRTKRSLTAEEWAELKQIASNYKSPTFHAFYSFYAQDREPSETSDSMKVTSPGICHAINFVRNIPGVSKLNTSDLCELISCRLIDVMALQMAEIYNTVDNELCFFDFRLRECDVEDTYPKMKLIFKYAKFYSKFLSPDGMILGCLCATRFLNADGLTLKYPEKVDQALDYIVNLSLKYWATLENNTLLKELCKGLPDFENIREHELDRLSKIVMIMESKEEIRRIIQLNPVVSCTEVSSPDYMHSGGSTVSSLKSPSTSSSVTSEDEYDSDQVKRETSCDKEVAFASDATKSNSYGFGQYTNFRETTKDIPHKNPVLTPAVSYTGSGYSCHGNEMSQSIVSSSSYDRASKSKSPSYSSTLEETLPRMDIVSQNSLGFPLTNYGSVQQEGLNSQHGVSFISTAIPPSENPPFTPLQFSSQLSMIENDRVHIPYKTSSHSQGDVGASGEFFLHDKDIDILRKNNANLKEMVKYLCGLMETKGIYPKWETVWEAVQRRGVLPNLHGTDMDAALHIYHDSLPVSAHHQSSQTFSILHHPEVSHALSSRQLSYPHDTYSLTGFHSHQAPSYVNSPSLSSSSHSSFQLSPDTPQHAHIIPRFDSESLRNIGHDDQLRSQSHHQTSSKTNTYWHSPYQPQTFNSASSTSDLNQERMSAFQIPYKPPVSFKLQAMHSSSSQSGSTSSAFQQSSSEEDSISSGVSGQSSTPATAVQLLKQESFKVMSFKKKWLQNHLKEER